ncbi:hypothetical protein BX600DRAFT_513855 [Xylariales sp. PMI_506]|nr:hypothetical protein BX600DRAFT_513855 [Xylariales sp. PMI_506]
MDMVPPLPLIVVLCTFGVSPVAAQYEEDMTSVTLGEGLPAFCYNGEWQKDELLRCMANKWPCYATTVCLLELGITTKPVTVEKTQTTTVTSTATDGPVEESAMSSVTFTTFSTLAATEYSTTYVTTISSDITPLQKRKKPTTALEEPFSELDPKQKHEWIKEFGVAHFCDACSCLLQPTVFFTKTISITSGVITPKQRIAAILVTSTTTVTQSVIYHPA